MPDLPALTVPALLELVRGGSFRQSVTAEQRLELAARQGNIPAMRALEALATERMGDDACA